MYSLLHFYSKDEPNPWASSTQLYDTVIRGLVYLL